MRRSLLAVPFLALLAGLLLLLWAKRPGLPESASAGKDLPPAEPRPHDGHAHPPPRTADRVPTTEAATGSLLVRVTGGGKPLAGALLGLAREDGDGRMRIETGPDGARLILQIPPGHYTATASHPRFLHGSVHVTVPSGGRATADLELKAGGRIFGRVTDGSGAPLSRTNVSLVEAESQFGVGSHLTAKTDDAGRYELAPVPPGDYGVRFKHEQFKPQDRLGLSVRTGAEEMEVNVALELGARIAGRVLDEQGMPLAGARVIFGNPGGGGVVQSDPEGRFVIYGLTEAPCGGSAALKGYGTAYRRNVPPNTLDVEFRLSKSGTLAGRLLAEPLPDHFTVCLSTYDAELGRPLRIHQQSLSYPPEGRFVLDDLAPGTYWLEVEAPDYECVEQPQVAIASGQTSPLVTVRLRKK